MNKTLLTALSMTMATSMVSTTFAKTEKNEPRNTSAVEKALEEASEGHFPEKIKINEIGSIKAGDTFFHAYCGAVKKEPYRILIFDNTPTYLGYYPTWLEPDGYEEGAVLLASGDGESYINLPIDVKGPSKRGIQLENGTMIKFVKNKNLEEKIEVATGTKAIAVPKEKSKSGMEIDYREWTISMKGKKIPFRAIFVKREGSRVFLKDEKRGITKDFLVTKLSTGDKNYIKKLEK